MKKTKKKEIDVLLSSVPRDGKGLFLSPHPDDIAFSIAETFSRCSSYGIATRLLCVFSESAYTVKRDIPKNPDTVSILRLSEDKAFIRDMYPGCKYGRLGLKDSMLRSAPNKKFPRIRELAVQPNIDLIETVATKIKYRMCTADLIFCPLAIGDHTDHTLLREAVIRNIRLLQGTTVIFYEDLPYCSGIPDQEVRQLIYRMSFRLPNSMKHVLCRIQNMGERLALCERYYPSQTNRGTLNKISTHLNRTARYPAERLWAVRIFE